MAVFCTIDKNSASHRTWPFTLNLFSGAGIFLTAATRIYCTWLMGKGDVLKSAMCRHHAGKHTNTYFLSSWVSIPDTCLTNKRHLDFHKSSTPQFTKICHFFVSHFVCHFFVSSSFRAYTTMVSKGCVSDRSTSSSWGLSLHCLCFIILSRK